MRGLFGVLLGGNLSASGSTGVPAGASAAPRPGWGGVWGGAMTNSTRRVTPDIALSLSTVYGAVNLLAKTLGSLPILMYRKDREGRLFEAPEAAPARSRSPSPCRPTRWRMPTRRTPGSASPTGWASPPRPR